MEQQVVYGGEHHSGRPARPVWGAMRSGFSCRCPRCGEGRLFRSFLKTFDDCEVCGEAFHHHRADDLPAYLVVVIVGHVVVAAFMAVEASIYLPLWAHLTIWLPSTAALCLALLRPIKGAVVGLQWALYMHGFGGQEDTVEQIPDTEA